MEIKITASSAGKADIYAGTEKKFSISNTIFSRNKQEDSFAVKIKGNAVERFYPGCIHKTEVRFISSGYFKILHTWSFTSGGEKNLSSFISFPAENPELFIPSVLFRKNDKGIGRFFKGGIEKKFILYEDRTPLPGCTVIVQKNGVVISCLDDPSKKFKTNPALVGGFVKGKNAVCALYCQGDEKPFSYQGKTRTLAPSRKRSYITIPECSKDKPYILKRSQFIYFGNCNAQTTDSQAVDYNAVFDIYRNFIEIHTAYTHKKGFMQKGAFFFDWKSWFELKKEHLLFLSEIQDESGAGAYIKMGKGNGDIQYVYEFTGASFLVKSIEAACIFSETGEPVLAEKIGNFFLQAETPPLSGVFKDNHNLKTGEWGGYLGIAEDKTYGSSVNARCNGEAMIAYIRLYESLLKQGIKRDDFIALAKHTAFFYLRSQLKNGSFGRWWTAGGKVVNKDGTNGAYILCLLIALLPYCTSDEIPSIKNAITKAADYYMQVIEKADFYGDTLDADACDKESAVILLRAALDLYEYTGETRYINSAQKAAHFVLTWTWFYNVPFAPNTPLGKARFLTAGMTSVSTAHHHLDFYGMYIARDFFRLSKALGKQKGGFYDNTAKFMMNACRQLIACETRPLGKGPELKGWQPEQINHTAWDYFDRPDRQKGFFDVCIAWVPVLTLGAYLSIKSEFPEKLE